MLRNPVPSWKRSTKSQAWTTRVPFSRPSTRTLITVKSASPSSKVHFGKRSAAVTSRGRTMSEWAYPDLEDVRTAGTPIQTVAGWKMRDGALVIGDASQRVILEFVDVPAAPEAAAPTAEKTAAEPKAEAKK